MTKHSFICIFLGVCLLVSFVSCNEKETNLGLDLQDPSTIYSGTLDTAYGVAYTVYDDSLLTSGLATVLVGSYDNPDFGRSTSELFTQISTNNSSSLVFDQYCTIDSVVMSFSISSFFPAVEDADAKTVKTLHFNVTQLAEPLSKDSAYYGDSEIQVSSTQFFDGDVQVTIGDTMMVSFKLNDNFKSIIDNKSFATSSAFEQEMKGVRVTVTSGEGDVMVSLNLSATSTRLTAYYTYQNGGDPTPRTYEFAFGSTVPHFSHYTNQYYGLLAPFNSNRKDSIDGASSLYLCPMGGTNIKFSIDSFVRQFHQQHPLAIIHYAELIMPVSASAPSTRPELIAALQCFDNGVMANIPDMYDALTYAGFDGKYNEATGCYRLRITQHMQNLVKAGRDNGTLLVISGRRTSSEHTIINGYSKASTGGNAIRVALVYSE